MTFQILTELEKLFQIFRTKLLKSLVTICGFVSSFKSECRNTDCLHINDLPMNNNYNKSPLVYKHVVLTYITGYMASCYRLHIIA